MVIIKACNLAEAEEREEATVTNLTIAMRRMILIRESSVRYYFFYVIVPI